MRRGREGMPYFHVKRPKSQPCLNLPSGSLGETLTVCAKNKKPQEFYLAFSGLWPLHVFLWDYGTWNKPRLFLLFQFQQGKLTHFSLSRVWCQLRVDCQNETRSSWMAYDACVSNIQIYLPLPHNWLSCSGRSLCWISFLWNRSDDSRYGSENL